MARVVQFGGSRERYWRMVVARWKRSGLSVRTFCQAENLNQRTFEWWRRELNRRELPKPAFLPVRVPAEKAGSLTYACPHCEDHVVTADKSAQPIPKGIARAGAAGSCDHREVCRPSENGGKTMEILFSIVSSCQRHGQAPFAYLRDVLGRLPGLPKERMVELLPDRWTPAEPADATSEAPPPDEKVAAE